MTASDGERIQALQPIERLKSLDGLRAICVALVFMASYHWSLPFGWAGVLVFYVLSGFLITRILLQEREHAQQEREHALTTQHSPAHSAHGAGFFKRFYFRRTLRIAPLYFAYLIGIELVHAAIALPEGWNAARPYAYFYGVNFGLMNGDVIANAAYGHLWTLSVEEQFYLVWPIVVWLTSRASLLRIAIAIVALGPLIRYACAAWLGLATGEVYMLSTSHLDAFAVGAVLATHDFTSVRKAWPLALGALAITLGLGFLVLLATGNAIRTLGYSEGLAAGYGYIWGYTVLNITSGLVILAALRGELPWLETPVLAYLGKISYGIYLVQRPLKGVYFDYVEPKLMAAIPSHMLALIAGAVLCAIATMAISAASYRYFEAPLLRLRDRVMPPIARI